MTATTDTTDLTLYAAIDVLAHELDAAGLRVCTDPAAFNAPCVVIEAPTVTTATMDAWTLTVPVSVVGPQPADRRSLAYLLETLPAVLAVCNARQADPSIYSPNGTQSFPAYRLTATIHVRRTN